MRRTLSNRTVAVIVAAFTVAGALVMRANPFGTGTIPWPGAIAVPLAVNCFLAYAVAAWAAPYAVSTGGRAGAREAPRARVAAAERWIAGGLMTASIAAMFVVSLTSRDLIVTPTDRLRRNAELVRRTVEAYAPANYRRLVTAADTWKLSPRMYRTCVPSGRGDDAWWCVLVAGSGGAGTNLRVVRYGPALSNARQFLKWHPGYKPEQRYY